MPIVGGKGKRKSRSNKQASPAMGGKMWSQMMSGGKRKSKSSSRRVKRRSARKSKGGRK